MVDFFEAVDSEKTDRLSRRIWAQLRNAALERDQENCGQCGASHALEVDHIVPLALGGTNALENLQTLCGLCHRIKTREDHTQMARAKIARRLAERGF
jgi:5-methylcytosine-specific restriction protein A